jgi:NAD(P)-dependent dehydrogenase (short-subunit alcohol dehydrogenase family)
MVAAGHQAIAFRCDVADEAQVKAMVEKTVATFGRLDAAFNNARIQSPVAETADASGADFDRVIGVNTQLDSGARPETDVARHKRDAGKRPLAPCRQSTALLGVRFFEIAPLQQRANVDCGAFNRCNANLNHGSVP